jgi:hypothetical protein
VRREWTPEELIEQWTLLDADWVLVANKTGATRLGFAVMLKFFELDGRFPRHGGEVPLAALEYVATQVKVPAGAFGEYEWSGRTVEYHRAQVRTALGFREATVGDEDKLVVWLSEEVCAVELGADRLRQALVARCRAERIEPPTPGRLERMLGAATAGFEQRFTALDVSRLSGHLSNGVRSASWDTANPVTRGLVEGQVGCGHGSGPSERAPPVGGSRIEQFPGCLYPVSADSRVGG